MTPDEDIAYELNRELGQAEQREIDRRVARALTLTDPRGDRTMSEPTPDPAQGSQAIPTTPCDSCGKEFEPGDVWNYHARLGVYVHTSCAAGGPVRGEDITTHTVLWGQVPNAPEVTPAVRRAAEAMATDQEHIPWAGHRHPDNWEDHARAALSAGLDLEEMATEADRHYVSGYDGGNTVCNCGVVVAPGKGPRHIATALRTAILGPDVVWQGDGVRAVASDLVAVDEEGDE